MTDSDRLQRIETRQDQLFQALLDFAGVLEDSRERLAWLQAWASEPPSDELPKLLTAMTTALGGLQEEVRQHGLKIEAVSDRLADLLARAP